MEEKKGPKLTSLKVGEKTTKSPTTKIFVPHWVKDWLEKKLNALMSKEDDSEPKALSQWRKEMVENWQVST